jgi:hypothetical protein
MVDAVTRQKENNWGFQEEPPTAAMTTGTTGTKPAVGLERTPAAHACAPWHSPIATIDLSSVMKPAIPTRTTTSIAAEIAKLNTELAKSPDAMRAAQLRALQSDWVAQAKAEGRREPNGPLNPLRATPKEIENAFLWSEIGGVIPRDELARDGGKAYQTSIRDAVVLHVKGFDAVLAMHSPEERTALLTEELGLRGVTVPAHSSVDDLYALYRQSVGNEESQRPSLGIDGRTGTAENVSRSELDAKIEATNPGSTFGSIFANWYAAATGNYDVDRMRALGNAGNAIEGAAGGIGNHLNGVALEREPPETVKPNIDGFNKRGLGSRYETKGIDPDYKGESRPGNSVWRSERTGQPMEVKYEKREGREQYKLEARPVTIDGRTEIRLFDAEGKLFDTRDATTYDGRPRAIFVVNAQGEIYASTYQEKGYFHHSSLANGQPVAAAGELVVENGKLISISNQSGHYKPGDNETMQLVDSLRGQGLDVTGVHVELLHTAESGRSATETRVLQ